MGKKDEDGTPQIDEGTPLPRPYDGDDIKQEVFDEDDS